MYLVYFFFSSRRRHTRSLRDWSSDVCSSDLVATGILEDPTELRAEQIDGERPLDVRGRGDDRLRAERLGRADRERVRAPAMAGEHRHGEAPRLVHADNGRVLALAAQERGDHAHGRAPGGAAAAIRSETCSSAPGSAAASRAATASAPRVTAWMAISPLTRPLSGPTRARSRARSTREPRARRGARARPPRAASSRRRRGSPGPRPRRARAR